MGYITRGTENLMVVKVLNIYLKGHKGFVAGGCFKNIFNKEKIKDIDIFFRDENDYEEAIEYFDLSQSEYYFYYQNEKVKAYENKNNGVVIELIQSVFGTPEEIINGFDFSITKIAYDGKKITHHNDFFEHLYLKRLVLEKIIKFPVSTFERALKYKGYGYSLCRESKVNLLNNIKTNTNENDVLGFGFALYEGVD